MNWLDYVFLFFILVFSIQGLSEGFARLVVGLAAAIAGLFVASWTYGVAAAYLLPFVSSRSVANVLGFVLIFIAIQILGAIVGRMLHKLFKWTGLGWLDRLLGFAFGSLKAILVGIVLVLILTAFPMKPVPDAVSRSRIAPYLIGAAQAISYIAPRELRDGFAETYDRLLNLWKKGIRELPKEHLETDNS